MAQIFVTVVRFFVRIFRRMTGPSQTTDKGRLDRGGGQYVERNVFPDRTDVQCLHRCQKVLNPNLVKGPWTKEEDDLIIELVEKQGMKKWVEIAKQLRDRIGKQCGERWHNHLYPDIKITAWTKEEESTLIKCHWNVWEQMGWDRQSFCLGRPIDSIKPPNGMVFEEKSAAVCDLTDEHCQDSGGTAQTSRDLNIFAYQPNELCTTTSG
ncbi:hypothetical protein Patl1_00385 [Pistacia atlantica]|uniref:Uncharacterized protein n=1 Tax=Pistacia atlantica TaxID=434234 RepID=A0ACC1C3Z7_9ROSI|nr:hypothetical protein Patl1_00385 [Pistacia atlantica]